MTPASLHVHTPWVPSSWVKRSVTERSATWPERSVATEATRGAHLSWSSRFVGFLGACQEKKEQLADVVRQARKYRCRVLRRGVLWWLQV